MHFGLTALTLSDGSVIHPPLPGICVIAGPNNAGKSALLRDIFQRLHGQPTRWLRGLEADTRATDDEIGSWFAIRSRPVSDPNSNTREQRIVITAGNWGTPQFNLVGFQQAVRQVAASRDPGVLGPAFVRHLDAEGRLAMTNPGPPRNVSEQATHPLHILWDDIEAERRLSDRVRQAFGTPVSINRFAQHLQLLIGEPLEGMKVPPEPRDINDLLMRPPLDSNNVGDGIRSFAGTLLHIGSERESIYLIDEPEAFLHPPQARMLGRAIAEMTPESSQVFVATHSAEMLEGLLTATSSRDLAVVRLTTADVANTRRADVLPAVRVQSLWTDPVIRSSGALDGLFSPATVICEGDSDVRFYSAAAEDASATAGKPFDTHWIHVGGKARIASMLADLRSFGVKAAAIVDFDIFRDEADVRKLADACGIDWTDLESDLRTVASEVATRASAPTVGAFRSSLANLFARSGGSAITDGELETIRDLARPDSGWRDVKRHGLAALEASTESARRLLNAFQQRGVFVVPVGALEGWYPNSGPKSGWVVRALEAKLHIARPQNLSEFLSEIANFVTPTSVGSPSTAGPPAS